MPERTAAAALLDGLRVAWSAKPAVNSPASPVRGCAASTAARSSAGIPMSRPEMSNAVDPVAVERVDQAQIVQHRGHVQQLVVDRDLLLPGELGGPVV